MPDKLQEKPLPHNTEMEQQVLCTILLENKSMDELIDKIKPEFFYKDFYRKLFMVCVELWREQIPIDSISASNRYKKNYTDFSIEDFYQIDDSLPSLTSCENSIYELRELFAKRKLIQMSWKIESMAFEDPSCNLLEITSAEIESIQNVFLETSESEIDTIYDAIKKYTDGLENNELEWRIETGIIKLDDTIDGLKKGRMYVIGGHPSKGKTTLVSNIMYRASINGNKTLFISLDESIFSVTCKMMAMATKIPITALVSNFRKRNIINWESLREFMKIITQKMEFFKKITIRDSLFNILQIEAEAKRLKKQKDIDLIVIDYATCIDADKTLSATEEQSQIIMRIKRLGRMLNVPIVLLSQLTKETKGPITLSKLLGSGAAGQAPDVVIGVYKKDHDDQIDKNSGIAEDSYLIILKNKNGRTGKIPIRWLLDYGIMGNPEEYQSEETNTQQETNHENKKPYHHQSQFTTQE